MFPTMHAQQPCCPHRLTPPVFWEAANAKALGTGFCPGSFAWKQRIKHGGRRRRNGELSEERAESASDFAADDENEKVNVFIAVLLKKDFWRLGYSKVSNSFVSVWSDLSKGLSVISPTSWSVNLVYYRYIRPLWNGYSEVEGRGGGSNLKDHSWGDEYFVESHNVFSRFNNVLD